MPETISKRLVQLFALNGQETYGEDITQTEHAVQCAELALRANESNALITAALLHDVGHLLAATDIAFGNYKHDALGADYLTDYFPPEVTEPIRLHAQAKRYLCSVEKDYLSSLSAASLDSLQHQGGLMNPQEQQQFLSEPFAGDAIKLRRWDDEGKVQELSERAVSDYLPQLESSLNQHYQAEVNHV